MKAGSIPRGALAAVLPVVTVVTAVVVGVAFGVELSALAVAAGALAGVIALLWASVQALTGESPITLEEALTLGAPSTEEEQKRSVLRALKDLEFERGVGKISEEDYAELSTRYRSEAKRLIQLLDEGSQPERDRAEKALLERLAKAPARSAATTAAAQESDAETPPSARDSETPPEPSDAAAAEGAVASDPAPSKPNAVAAPEGEKAS